MVLFKRNIFLLKILPLELLVSIFLFVAFFSIFLAQNHYIFNTYAWDLGLFNQVLWSTLHGEPFYYTLEPFWSQYNNFLATHFAPILIIILPFYALYPKPETLLIIHSAIISLGGVAAYKLSYFLLKNKSQALIFSFLYLLNPLIVGQALSSFHLEDLFMTFMMFTIYFFVKKDYWKYFISLNLTLMTIEYAAIPLIFFGIAMLVMINKWGDFSYNVKFSIPLITIIFSLLYFILVQNIQIALGLIRLNIHQEWRILGANSIFEVPLKVLENPVLALEALSYDSFYKLWYLLMIFMPVLFLPLLKPTYLLPILPWIMISLFSNYPAYYVISSHYPAFIAPFIFLATIYGFRKIAKSIKRAKSKKLLIIAILTITILSLLFDILRIRTIYHFTGADLQHVSNIYDILSLVPNNASVLAQDNIFPHLSSRFEAYTIPSPTWEGFSSISVEMLNNVLDKKPEYIIVDLKADNQHSRAMGELILSTLSRLEFSQYSLIVERDGIYLFRLNHRNF
ncbi:MAG: DUF2079 domain-containing protein [Nitrososphaerales archaeon]